MAEELVLNPGLSFLTTIAKTTLSISIFHFLSATFPPMVAMPSLGCCYIMGGTGLWAIATKCVFLRV
ncbi:hypothetical protein D082_07720 [Synechocystis sp. PCC 6714]|nr:hypothetical protein D082_07720 [Synechocystis sp. PCC 6714]